MLARNGRWLRTVETVGREYAFIKFGESMYACMMMYASFP